MGGFLMDFKTIIDLLSRSNINQEAMYELVGEASSLDLREEDNLRKYGISKEHKPNPIVGMGLFMDGDGLPLSCNIYPSNKNEQETLLPEENKIVNNFKLIDLSLLGIIIVNDCSNNELNPSIKR